MPEEADGPTIAVCICTSGHRAEALDRLLNALERPETVPDDVERVIVVVADNTPHGKCRDQIERRRPATVVYCHEPVPGVSHARNASVAAALATDPDYLAFIDDDEEPDPGWLAALLGAARSFRVPIVAGPVLERGDLPGRIEPRPTPTGAFLDQAYTGNLLIARPVLDSLASDARPDGSDAGWPFDHRFDRSGGEDVHLTRRLRAAGHRIVWCNEAVVHTDVGPADVTLSRTVRRAFHGALNAERARRAVDGRQIRRIPLGAAIAVRGCGYAGLDLLRGRSTHGSLLRVAAGIGVILGAAGVPVRGHWWVG